MEMMGGMDTEVRVGGMEMKGGGIETTGVIVTGVLGMQMTDEKICYEMLKCFGFGLKKR